MFKCISKLIQIKQGGTKNELETLYRQELNMRVKEQLQKVFASELEQKIYELRESVWFDIYNMRDISSFYWIDIIDYGRGNMSLLDKLVANIVRKESNQLYFDARFDDLWIIRDLEKKVKFLFDCLESIDNTGVLIDNELSKDALVLLSKIIAQLE